VNKYNNNYTKLLESFGSILFKKRMFYPRNFNLSEPFVNSLKKEIDRLKKENYTNQQIVSKLSKALHFLCK
jgi:hypothetical protein